MTILLNLKTPFEIAKQLRLVYEKLTPEDKAAIGTTLAGASVLSGVVLTAFNKFRNHDPKLGVVNTLNTSLPEYTASTRLSPSVLIDKRILALDPKLVTALEQTLLSMYCGWYLQGINLALNVNNVMVNRILDQFSTDRSILQSALNTTYFDQSSTEEISDELSWLPDYSNEAGYGFEVSGKSSVKRSSSDSKPNYTGAGAPKEPEKVKEYYTSPRTPEGTNNPNSNYDYGVKGVVKGEAEKTEPKITFGANRSYTNKDAIHSIMEESNLAVGKILEVQVIVNNQYVTIPVTVTLMPESIDAKDLINVIAASVIDKTSTGRWRQLRSGAIRFWKDYLGCADLIEADKKALLADHTGVLLNTRTKNTNTKLATLASGYASPNAISTMIIISKQTFSDLELVLKGNFTKNIELRNKYFESTSSMMLVVVDIQMERFTIFIKGIAAYKEHTLDDIKKANKGTGGSDILEFMKAMSKGNIPNF